MFGKLYDKEIDGDKIIYKPSGKFNEESYKDVRKLFDQVAGDVMSYERAYWKAEKRAEARRKSSTDDRIKGIIKQELGLKDGGKGYESPRAKSYVIKAKDNSVRSILEKSLGEIRSEELFMPYDMAPYHALNVVFSGLGSAIGSVVTESWLPLLGMPAGAAVGVGLQMKKKKNMEKKSALGKLRVEE